MILMKIGKNLSIIISLKINNIQNKLMIFRQIKKVKKNNKVKNNKNNKNK